jgi:hypothetical protein
MSHLDEGTLHALLDGELDLHEVKEIQAHIGSCAACGTRLREVKEFHGESDRLVGVLELPTTPSRRTAPPGPVPVEFEEPAPEPRPAPREWSRVSGPVNEPPPLLLPENPGYQRGGLIWRMRWAALLLVTVGAGYMASQMRRSSNFAFEGELVPVRMGDSAPTAVLSSEEDASANAPPAGEGAPGAARVNAATPPPEAKAAPAPQRVVRTAESTPAPGPAPEEEPEAPEPAPRGESVAAAGFEDTAEQSEDEADLPPARQADVRTEAAVALRQLDRERQIERAEAATAALDSARRREAQLRPVTVTAAPAPRTPEQRAQTYLRIGLDEAAKQLGRPVHVIEGMSQMFMGLVLGRNSPGADATRPVVRVVYQDSQGRLIFLDQQRLRPGQTTSQPGAEPHWIVGEISLHLSGEVGPDILRNYRARVR